MHALVLCMNFLCMHGLMLANKDATRKHRLNKLQTTLPFDNLVHTMHGRTFEKRCLPKSNRPQFNLFILPHFINIYSYSFSKKL
jgi:hypothetical protein